MKRIICALTAALMILSITACTEKSGQGKSLSYPLEASPSTLDPQYADETGAKLIINNVFEGLVRLDGEGGIIPGLAETWEVSDDGLIYTFHLQEGTEWYCPATLKKEYGDEFYDKFSSAKVTAADFVFACRRAVDPATASPLAHRLGVIENASQIGAGEKDVTSLGVTAQDDTTLIFRLAMQCPDFLMRLTESEFMPCNEEFFNEMGGRYGLTVRHIMCNGPFFISYWDPEASMTVKANRYYAGTRTVLPVSVSFVFGNDSETVNKKLASSSFSAAFLGPDEPLPSNVKVEKNVVNTVYGFIFNCSDEVLKKGDIRKGLCGSIDRSLFETEADNVYPQSGVIPESCVAGAYSYRSLVGEQTPVIEHNETEAVKRWNKGLASLETDNVTLTVLCPEEYENAVRNQIQIWQRLFGLSITVSVEPVSPAQIASGIKSGNFQIALGSVTAQQNDAVSFLADLSETNPFRYNSKNYRAVIERLVTVTSEEDITGGCFTAEDYLLKQGVCFPLYSKAARFVVSNDVSGIEMPGSQATVSFINAK